MVEIIEINRNSDFDFDIRNRNSDFDFDIRNRNPAKQSKSKFRLISFKNKV
jgi:hypothetical protein